MTQGVYFPSASAFGAWLTAHQATESELLVGFWKAHTGRPTLTWPESVDEALRVGWIDAVRRSVDDERYTIRFTRRTPGSIWSKVNVAKIEALVAAGRMLPAGLAAYAARAGTKTGTYSHEQPRDTLVLTPEEDEAFTGEARAWFETKAGSYRRAAIWWVLSAKKPETRAKRLGELVTCSAERRTLKHLTRR